MTPKKIKLINPAAAIGKLEENRILKKFRMKQEKKPQVVMEHEGMLIVLKQPHLFKRCPNINLKHNHYHVLRE